MMTNRHRDNHLIKQAASALNQIKVPFGNRVKRAGINNFGIVIGKWLAGC